jgi:glutaredoxin
MTHDREKVVLYTRSGCHLCEEAEQILAEHGILPTIVDIDGDSALRERFNTCVPVVEIDGKVRFRGRVNRVLLRRLLRYDS